MSEITKETHEVLTRTNNFQKLTRENLSDRVVRQIKEKIDSGELKPKDKLPTEQELAGGFGISKMTLREGLKILHYTNVLSALPGGGYEVQEPGLSNLINGLSEIYKENISAQRLRELKEMRLTIEVKAVQLACLRRSEEDLTGLLEAMDKMKHAVTKYDAEAMIDTSIQFHNRVARASGNELFVIVLDSIQDVTRKGRKESFAIKDRYQLSVEEHDKIYKAIKEKDVITAQELMQNHIETSF